MNEGIIVPSFRLNRVSYHDIISQLRKNLNKLDKYNLYTVNTYTHTSIVSYTYVCLCMYVLNHPSVSHVHMAWSHKHWET